MFFEESYVQAMFGVLFWYKPRPFLKDERLATKQRKTAKGLAIHTPAERAETGDPVAGLGDLWVDFFVFAERSLLLFILFFVYSRVLVFFVLDFFVFVFLFTFVCLLCCLVSCEVCFFVFSLFFVSCFVLVVF